MSEMIIDSDGNKKWLLNKNTHREEGPAIEWTNGNKEWYLYGRLHRTDGPAIECSDGHKEWCINGLLHREDGPAIEWVNGDIRWYLNNKEYSKEDWFEMLSEDSKMKALFSEHFFRE